MAQYKALKFIDIHQIEIYDISKPQKEDTGQHAIASGTSVHWKK